MSGADDDDSASTFVGHKFAQEIGRRLTQWRLQFPTRLPVSDGVQREIDHLQKPRPSKSEQRSWTTYRRCSLGRLEQEWLLTPFFATPPTQPLAGAPTEAMLDLFGNVTHYTSIGRVSWLAKLHPLVESVDQHKLSKSLDDRVFDSNGRAIKGHQSPFDLKLKLAASSGAMLVGVSVHLTKSDLLSLWWKPLKCCRKSDLSTGRLIFFDIMEAWHFSPSDDAEEASIAASGAPRLSSVASSSSAPPPPVQLRQRPAPLPVAKRQRESPPPPPLRPAPRTPTSPPRTVTLRPAPLPRWPPPQLGPMPPPTPPPQWPTPTPREPTTPPTPPPGLGHDGPPSSETAPPWRSEIEETAAASGAAAAAADTTAASGAAAAAAARPGVILVSLEEDDESGSESDQVVEEVVSTHDSVRLSERRQCQARRTRRRSKSRPNANFGDDAANDDDEDELSMYMTSRRIQKLTDEQKEKLRCIIRKENSQQHFLHFKWGGGGGAASGAFIETVGQAKSRAVRIANVWRQVDDWANPIPSAENFVNGVSHWNNNSANLNKLWDVVRATHSTKMHYFSKLKADMSSDALRFNQSFPDLSPESDGHDRLSDSTWQHLQQAFDLNDKTDYVKHILAKHDGEARMLSDHSWDPFPASGGNVRQACYWHYQFATTPRVRNYLRHRLQEHWYDADLTDYELDWIVKEEKGETSLLKYDDDSKQWYIRQGNMISLAELFYLGRANLACYDLYRLYVTLDIFIFKRFHSTSNTAGGQLRRNAKMLRYHETGRWALPES